MIDNNHPLDFQASRIRPLLTTFTAVILLTTGSLAGCSRSLRGSETKLEMPMTIQCSGTFEVTLNPQGQPDVEEGTTLGRLSIDKAFQGDLEATSQGDMLSVRTSIDGSAGYVAIERVIGSLHGRAGSFVLQHSAVMTRGIPQLNLTIVPDSGSGELKGISGSMTIKIVDGEHFYELEYVLETND